MEAGPRPAPGSARPRPFTAQRPPAWAPTPRPSAADGSLAQSCGQPARGAFGGPVLKAAARAWPPALGPAPARWPRPTIPVMAASSTWTPRPATRGPAWVCVHGKGGPLPGRLGIMDVLQTNPQLSPPNISLSAPPRCFVYFFSSSLTPLPLECFEMLPSLLGDRESGRWGPL